jgi:hypothetical protein
MDNCKDLKKTPHSDVRRRAVANVPAFAGVGFEEIEYHEQGVCPRDSR